MRRLAKPLTFLLIAAQLLLAVPAVAAAPVSRAGATEMPCDGMPMLKAMHGADHCPCCPAGAHSMTECLASCLMAAVATPSIFTARVVPAHAPRHVELPLLTDSFSTPPLKPPPIA